MSLIELLKESRFIALKHYLNEATYQEYYDWANKLLVDGVFFHELAMIASGEHEKSTNVFFYTDLQENLKAVFRRLGIVFIDNREAKYDAYDELSYLYCEKILNKNISLEEGVELLHDINYENFRGYVNVWSYLSEDVSELIKESKPYSELVISTLKNYMLFYENNEKIAFFDIENRVCPHCFKKNSSNHSENSHYIPCQHCHKTSLLSEYLQQGHKMYAESKNLYEL